jgi:hypothetical protein
MTQTETYLNCVASGTHRPGKETVGEPRLWKGVYLRFPICGTCGVPIPPKPKATKMAKTR